MANGKSCKSLFHEKTVATLVSPALLRIRDYHGPYSCRAGRSLGRRGDSLLLARVSESLGLPRRSHQEPAMNHFNAMDGFTHEIVTLAAQNILKNFYRDDLATCLSNYQTHYQMALDLNQPSDIRIGHHTQAVHWGWEVRKWFT
jgi:hypothetical protein